MSRYYANEEFAHHGRDGSGPVEAGAEGDTFVRETMTVLPPPSNNARPRSLPPQTSSAVVRRGRSASRSWSRSRSRSRSSSGSRDRDRGITRGSRSRSRAHTPLGRARDVVEDNFTSSTAGIGASILGAVVGGFVANRASEALQQRRHQKGSGGGNGHRRRDSDEANVPRIASTILGAVAGGLGANALANHLEDSRDRGRDRHHNWERSYSREEDAHHYDSGRGLSYEQDNEYDYVYEDDQRYDRQHRSGDFRYRN